MDGIMKINFKDSVQFILIPLMVFALIKIFWVVLETFVLSKEGISHTEVVISKPLYYRVKFLKQEQKTSKPVIKKHIANIKDIQLVAIYSDLDNVVVTVIYKNKTKVLAKGDKINGFKLISGTKDDALFEKNSKQYKIELIKTKSNNKSSIKVISSNMKQSKDFDKEGIVDKGDHKLIDRKIFEHFANNMDDIYKNIGIKEIKKKNKKEFQISFVKRGSPFAKLGIKRGDIIKSINGQAIDSYGAAFKAYGGIKGADMLTVIVIRNNKELELEYEIN
jgi:general secretion pathway protein C